VHTAAAEEGAKWGGPLAGPSSAYQGWKYGVDGGGCVCQMVATGTNHVGLSPSFLEACCLRISIVLHCLPGGLIMHLYANSQGKLFLRHFCLGPARLVLFFSMVLQQADESCQGTRLCTPKGHISAGLASTQWYRRWRLLCKTVVLGKWHWAPLFRSHWIYQLC
jgi:hypothetical protein